MVVADIIVRKASEADLPGVLALYSQPDLDDGDVLTLTDAREIFGRFSSYPDYTLYVASDGRKVVGTFALLIMENIGHLGAPSGVIEDVAVDPAYQGQGVGRQMMQFANDYCRERGCYKMALSSNLKRGSAHAFYESVGFEKHGYSFRINP